MLHNTLARFLATITIIRWWDLMPLNWTKPMTKTFNTPQNTCDVLFSTYEQGM